MFFGYLSIFALMFTQVLCPLNQFSTAAEVNYHELDNVKQKFMVSVFLRVRSPKSRCRQGHILSEMFKEILPCPFLGSGHLLAIFGILSIKINRSNPPSPYEHLPLSAYGGFHIRAPVISDWRATLFRQDPTLSNYVYNHSISNQEILR